MFGVFQSTDLPYTGIKHKKYLKDIRRYEYFCTGIMDLQFNLNIQRVNKVEKILTEVLKVC